MNHDWDHYLCRLDEDRASIYLDLGIAAAAPLATHSYSAVVSVTMLSPREDGLSSDEEFDRLIALEDHLASQLGAAGAFYVGRLTARGARVFYFYAADPATLAGTVEAAMAAHPHYRYQTAGRDDPAWSTYADFLYPSPGDYRRIQERRRSGLSS